MQKMLEIHRTLEQQRLQPKNGAIADGGTLNLDECGASSIQKFDGEDNTFDDRKKLQQTQFREWCEKAIELKKKRMTREKEIEQQEAQKILDEDQFRHKRAIEEEAERCRLNKLVMMENKHLAKLNFKIQEDIIRKEKETEDEETRNIFSSPFFCEETGHHFRPDHFKGFSPDKIKTIIQANAILIKEKEESKQKEIEKDQIWDELQSRMLHQMDEVEQVKVHADKENQKDITLTLQNQRKELKQRQIQMERAKFGEIGYGFFQKFGTSCR